MLEGIKHVVWDWNGTLLNDVDAALLSINAMLKERELPLLSKESYRDVFGFPVIDCYHQLGFTFQTDEEWDEIANEFHRHYNRNVEGAGLVRGVLEVLEGFAARGVGMSVLSASEEGKLNELLAHYGIEGYFENIMGHDNLYGSSKIDLGRRLGERLELDPASVLLIGDTVHDYQVAHNAGWRCALYLDGHQDAFRLKGCGCDTLEDIGSLFA